MKLGKIIGGICTIAAAPLAVAAAAHVAATAGAVAMVVGGVSEATAVGAGIVTMSAAESATVIKGTSMISGGMK